MNIPIGLKGHAEVIVSDLNTAMALGSGKLPVYGTPFLCGLLEAAAQDGLDPYLDEGSTTVGTQINITHAAATPIGMKVWADSVITAVDGRKISYDITAYDEAGIIGRAFHERFIIFNEKFMAKTNAKLEKAK